LYIGHPIIIGDIGNQRLPEGVTAFFTCQATGVPNPSISWYFNGVPVKITNSMKYMISEMSLNPTTKNSSLTIRNVNLSDNGTYTCNATSLSYSVTSTGVLIVHGEYVMIIANAREVSF